MDQNKSKSPKLFVCTAIEYKDDVEEVMYEILEVSQQRTMILVGHVQS